MKKLSATMVLVLSLLTMSHATNRGVEKIYEENFIDSYSPSVHTVIKKYQEAKFQLTEVGLRNYTRKIEETVSVSDVCTVKNVKSHIFSNKYTIKCKNSRVEWAHRFQIVTRNASLAENLSKGDRIVFSNAPVISISAILGMVKIKIKYEGQ